MRTLPRPSSRAILASALAVATLAPARGAPADDPPPESGSSPTAATSDAAAAPNPDLALVRAKLDALERMMRSAAWSQRTTLIEATADGRRRPYLDGRVARAPDGRIAFDGRMLAFEPDGTPTMVPTWRRSNGRYALAPSGDGVLLAYHRAQDLDVHFGPLHLVERLIDQGWLRLDARPLSALLEDAREPTLVRDEDGRAIFSAVVSLSDWTRVEIAFDTTRGFLPVRIEWARLKERVTSERIEIVEAREIDGRWVPIRARRTNWRVEPTARLRDADERTNAALDRLAKQLWMDPPDDPLEAARVMRSESERILGGPAFERSEVLGGGTHEFLAESWAFPTPDEFDVLFAPPVTPGTPFTDQRRDDHAGADAGAAAPRWNDAVAARVARALAPVGSDDGAATSDAIDSTDVNDSKP